MRPFLAQKAVDPLAKKKEIEERLAALNGNQPGAKSMAAFESLLSFFLLTFLYIEFAA